MSRRKGGITPVLRSPQKHQKCSEVPRADKLKLDWESQHCIGEMMTQKKKISLNVLGKEKCTEN